MRNWVFALSMTVFLTIPAWVQQNNTPPEQSLSPTLTVARADHSTKADLAVPLCPVEFNDGLRTNGIVNDGEKETTRPKLVHSVEFEISDEALHARMKKRLGSIDVILSFVIDMNGTPQNICIQKSNGYGLDANAAKVVRQYKFEPATKDGTPVPMRSSVEMTAY